MNRILIIIFLSFLLSVKAYAENKCIQGNCTNGYGTMVLKDKDFDAIYVGEFKDGRPHGQGNLKVEGGLHYIGEYKNGMMDGQGTLTYKDGRTIKGLFRKGKIINSTEINKSTIVKKPIKKNPSKIAETKPIQKVEKAPEINRSLLTIGSGSGFYINRQGYALTNNHVVSICRQNVSILNGKEILFRVIATDRTNDIAVIKSDNRPSNFIKINIDGAKLGENIVAVGYPLAGRLSDSVKITKGIVSSLSGINNNTGQIQIDAALQPGNSGGPVLNKNGVLVGMASAGLNKLLMAKEAKYIPENVNFAVASPIIVNVLKSKKIKFISSSYFSTSYSATKLAEIGSKSTIQLFCRNTKEAYTKLKKSKKYSQFLLDLE